MENAYLCSTNVSTSIIDMEQATDIRWIQRYANFHKACGRLLEVTEADRYMDESLGERSAGKDFL